MLYITEGYTFDDVLLKPRHSDVKSRSEVDLSVELSKGISLKIPVVPANMKSVAGIEMAEECYKLGGMAIIHRFMPAQEQLEIAKNLTKDKLNYIGFSIGIKKEDYGMVDSFAAIGVKILCIDIAHGDSSHCVNMTKYIAEKYPNIFLISGNVATSYGAKNLWIAGADCVKVGIGPGSLCTTRIETGNGVPQLSALSDIADMKNQLTNPWQRTVYKDNDDAYGKRQTMPPVIDKQIFVIADGGIKNAGDIVKALCFSDLVMAGNIFAGTEETPGEIMNVNGKRYKNYVGSSTHKQTHVEGVMALVPTKGPVLNIMQKLFEGLRSGLSYQGSKNLTELKIAPEFVKITGAGLKESHAHDVVVV